MCAGLFLLLAAGDQEDRIIGLYYGPEGVRWEGPPLDLPHRGI
jgi:hypothetical protein